jgi:hypothetical protein
MIPGKGKPVILVGNRVFSLPKPDEGGRISEYQKKETKSIINVQKRVAQGKPAYRFVGKYLFPRVDRDMIESLAYSLGVSGDRCIWIPYEDIPMQRFECFCDMQEVNFDGKIHLAGFQIDLKQINTTSHRTTRNNLVVCDPVTVVFPYNI